MKYYKFIGEDNKYFTRGNIYKKDDIPNGSSATVELYINAMSQYWIEVETNEVSNTNTKPYYSGNSSLYKFAEEWGLNAWEFEILKRIVRCRKKGEWFSDLNKTKEVIDIYIKECKDGFKGRDLEISEKF